MERAKTVLEPRNTRAAATIEAAPFGRYRAVYDGACGFLVAGPNLWLRASCDLLRHLVSGIWRWVDCRAEGSAAANGKGARCNVASSAI